MRICHYTHYQPVGCRSLHRHEEVLSCQRRLATGKYDHLIVALGSLINGGKHMLKRQPGLLSRTAKSSAMLALRCTFEGRHDGQGAGAWNRLKDTHRIGPNLVASSDVSKPASRNSCARFSTASAMIVTILTKSARERPNE